MAHSIISDEINAGTPKYSSWASLNVNKYQQMYYINVHIYIYIYISPIVDTITNT